ncbi:cobalt-precorrin-6A reductase [Candidatus Synechococcus calcipolaris G9]|uniref:Cobalt-precorrin-6A reductase n=1 Tax=Candidatus Synechococcus calcipolaris G9 TaxID=1497997 RepID=A0ABT6EY18_9SYNE|nr:cobalt-precorrin-6A reductase [Candidatus Synechococcus calcipolaris]MDG2989988.1 cobalt-precorrin-6A reductase [Candidatus Synechococcus calcipolaris G9]
MSNAHLGLGQEPWGDRGYQVWLIGGTQESREIAHLLLEYGLSCVVTVTTAAARHLYPVHPQLHIVVTTLRQEEAKPFLQCHRIQVIIDASHPFAVAISQLAISLSQELSLPYLRFERPSAPSAIGASIQLATIDELIQGDYLNQQRVLLTLGYRFLAHFTSWHDRSTLFARILPSIPALTAALAAGFSPNRLVALRPPISEDLERALWQQWRISLVVTKASGAPGGEQIKQNIAAQLGVQLITINRPEIAYPLQTRDRQGVIQFIKTLGWKPVS